jgi:2-dehydro-3-deoxygluconokinase
MRAICIGEAMVELRAAGPDLFARSTAGDAYNTAVYLKRSLGPDAEVSFLTAVGDDVMSGALSDDFVGEGLKTDLVFTVIGGAPGLYLIELDAQGDRSFHYWRSASAARQWLLALEGHGGGDALAGADLVYFSGITLAILGDAHRARALSMLANAKGRVGRIAFDPNIRPKLWHDLETARRAVEAASAVADIVLPSVEDGALIWGEADPGRQLDLYHACGATEIALTLGASGAILRVDGRTETLPPEPVRAIDTAGAGDSFNGAYLAARLTGVGPKDAARAGLQLAARVVQTPGALVARQISHPLKPASETDTP